MVVEVAQDRFIQGSFAATVPSEVLPRAGCNETVGPVNDIEFIPYKVRHYIDPDRGTTKPLVYCRYFKRCKNVETQKYTPEYVAKRESDELTDTLGYLKGLWRDFVSDGVTPQIWVGHPHPEEFRT